MSTVPTSVDESASDASSSNDARLVPDWFGGDYARLHPLLQQLHRARHARLQGTVEMQFGTGLAGRIGRRLARRLGLPDTAGPKQMVVDVRDDGDRMHWQRRFGDDHALLSLFRPVGHFPDGHWIEHTGPIVFTMQVDVVDGDWFWRLVGARMRGLPIPLWLLPRASAYKRIVDGRYCFHVGFALPLLGPVMGYAGLLDVVVPPAN
jgi:hypothetical protein